jgi:hypothetical protein
MARPDQREREEGERDREDSSNPKSWTQQGDRKDSAYNIRDIPFPFSAPKSPTRVHRRSPPHSSDEANPIRSPCAKHPASLATHLQPALLLLLLLRLLRLMMKMEEEGKVHRLLLRRPCVRRGGRRSGGLGSRKGCRRAEMKWQKRKKGRSRSRFNLSSSVAKEQRTRRRRYTEQGKK